MPTFIIATVTIRDGDLTERVDALFSSEALALEQAEYWMARSEGINFSHGRYQDPGKQQVDVWTGDDGCTTVALARLKPDQAPVGLPFDEAGCGDATN